MDHWEYKIITNDFQGGFDKNLTVLGKQGWELVAAVPVVTEKHPNAPMTMTGEILYIFKRPTL